MRTFLNHQICSDLYTEIHLYKKSVIAAISHIFVHLFTFIYVEDECIDANQKVRQIALRAL